MPKLLKDTLRDLGLTYEEALHGCQSAIAMFGGRGMEPKHLRVGVNSALVSNQALVSLLVDKGLFTLEEYMEYLRLAMNEEVAREQDAHPGITFR